jgi:predicted RNase H-like HicB family nuclease
MQKFYIAGIVPESADSGGGYSVYFPDLPNIAAGGETVEEAIRNATSGLYLALRSIAEQNDAVPEPSSLQEVRAKVQAEREGDDLPCPEDIVYQYIAAPVLDAVPVRLNVSLAKSLVQEMDAITGRMGVTRSGFIAAAARDYIDRLQG